MNHLRCKGYFAVIEWVRDDGQVKKSAIAAVLSAFPAKCRRHFAGDSIYGCMNSLLCAKEYRESSRQGYMCLV